MDSTRYATRNTKLASALLVLGFHLKADQPFTTVIDDGQSITTIWFEPTSRTVAGLRAFQVEAAWLDGSMEALSWMKRALETRDWIIKKVVYGDAVSRSVPGDGTFYCTEDLKLAAVIASMDYYLSAHVERRFYFPKPAGEIETVYKMSDAQLLSVKKEASRPVWCKKVILQQDILIAAVRKPQNVPLLITHGSGSKSAIIPGDAAKSYKRDILRRLHSDDL